MKVTPVQAHSQSDGAMQRARDSVVDHPQQASTVPDDMEAIFRRENKKSPIDALLKSIQRELSGNQLSRPLRTAFRRNSLRRWLRAAYRRQGKPTASFTELIALRTAPGSQKPAIVPSRAQRTSRAQRKSIIPVLIVCLGSALLATLTFYTLFDAPKPGPPIERPVALVTASWLNCREQPNPATNVLATAKQGEKLILHDQVGDWRRVRLHNSPCWVNSRYLRPTGQKVFDRPMTAY